MMAESEFFDQIASIGPQQLWRGVVGRAVHGERVTLSVVELDPDTFIPEHAHENEQVGMLVLGSLTFRIAGESRELAPGASWRIAANTPHEIGTGPDGAVVVEVFAPPRHDWETLERHEPRQPRWPGGPQSTG